MDAYPEGLLPAGHPLFGPVSALPPVSGLGLPGPAPTEITSAPAQEDFSCDEMEFLERVLRECTLHDGPAQPEQSPVAAPAGSAQWQPGANLPDRAAAIALPSTAATAEAVAGSGSQGGGEPTVAQWADEMVQRLQSCSSPQEASARCAELLAIFRQQCGGADPNVNPQRLQKLQGANSVLLRGLRSLNQRRREAAERAQRAEEANERLAAELARCQEALHASERAKGALQYHLQLMSVAPGTAAGGM